MLLWWRIDEREEAPTCPAPRCVAACIVVLAVAQARDDGASIVLGFFSLYLSLSLLCGGRSSRGEKKKKEEEEEEEEGFFFGNRRSEIFHFRQIKTIKRESTERRRPSSSTTSSTIDLTVLGGTDR